MDGFINLNKPTGMSSSAAVVKVRKILGEKKIGHLGTLDPMAAGVLPLGVGKGTKLFNYLIDKRKTYKAVFKFGVTTDTLDCEGRVTAIENFTGTKESVENAAKKFTGKLSQVPPLYSAKNVNGVRAYDLARQGKEFELKPKIIEVFKFELLEQIDEATFSFEICCSAGTYIRSLARDLAAEMKTVGYMSALTRTYAGAFSLSDALTLDRLESLGTKALLPLTYPLSGLEVWDVDRSQFKQLENGVKIKWLPDNDNYHLIICGGILFGVGKNKDGHLDLEFFLK